MKTLFLIVLLLLVNPALAWENPPAAYTGYYGGRLQVVSVPFNEVLRHCPGTGRAWACSYRSAGSCRVVLPSDLDAATVASLRAHEMAHCNGWAHR